MIRTVRSVLHGICREQILSDECLNTYMYKVMGIVNSPLTPNHLLHLKPSINLPPGKFVSQDLYRRQWRQVQYLANLFWTRWIKEYLPGLQQRQKWTKTTRNLRIGDLVLVLHENTPRCDWPLGLITEVHVGRDDKVRSATVRFRGALYSRPISKLCLLEGIDDNFS